MKTKTLFPALIIILLVFVLAGCSPAATTPEASQPPLQTTTTETVETNEQPADTPRITESEVTTPTTPAATATATETITEPEQPAVPAFDAKNPAVPFTDEDIAYLGLEGLTGTPAQIADAIRKWQEDNWKYAFDVMDFNDVADPIRWNYFLPGIFTSRDIIHQQVRDGKIYGICFSYAVVYSSVAEYYGLETRIMSTKSRISDSDPNMGSTTGMSPDEYKRLKIRLDEQGLRYDYDAVELVAEETPGHYWAEVKLDGEWRIQDATQKAVGFYTTAELYTKGDYQIYDWQSRDRSAELTAYQELIDAGKPLPEAEDDVPPMERATTIDEVMTGQALVPYFADAEDAYAFVGATNVPASDIAEDQYLIDEYERRTGEKLYLAALLICEDSGSGYLDCYYELCGEELDAVVYLSLASE